MDAPLVSIVVPAYNVELYINKCIDSLVKQKYTCIEIILVDDGSTDRTPEICDSWLHFDSRIQVIHKKNGGVSSARNCGILNAKGDYIFFVDGDDYLDREVIEVLLSKHDGKIDTIALVDFDRVKDDAVTAATSADNQIEVYKKSGIKEFAKVRRGWYCWGCLFKTELVINHSFLFDENLYNLEDVAWLGILLSYVNTIVYVKGTKYHYRMNPNSITSHCVNYAWQAQSWLKVFYTITNYFEENKMQWWRSKYVRTMRRYCINNFHAECYHGRLTFREMAELKRKEIPCGGGKCSTPMEYLEFVLYRFAFMLRKVLK